MKNKFILAIAGSAEGIKLARAINTANAAKLAQEALINDKKREVQALEAQLNNALDIGPDTADSLRPVGKNFDAASWVATIQNFKFSIKRANEQLAVAEDTYNEWFAEVPATVAAR